MTKIDFIARHIADLERWIAEARAEQARCVERGDTKQAECWASKAETFGRSATWWAGNLATFTGANRAREAG